MSFSVVVSAGVQWANKRCGVSCRGVRRCDDRMAHRIRMRTRRRDKRLTRLLWRLRSFTKACTWTTSSELRLYQLLHFCTGHGKFGDDMKSHVEILCQLDGDPINTLVKTVYYLFRVQFFDIRLDVMNSKSEDV